MRKLSRRQEPSEIKRRFGRALVVGLAVFASVILIRLTETRMAAAPPPDNLILNNPSFEVDANGDGFADGWSEYINIGSASLSSTEAFDGQYSQQLVSDTAGGAFAPRIVYRGGPAPGGTIPVAQDQPYTFAYWFKAAPGTRVIANIKGFNAAGGEYGPQTATTEVATGAWQRIFVSQTFTDPLQVSASVLPGLAVGDGGVEIFVDSAAFAPDDDRDGVFNTQDDCPGKPAGTHVADNGCPDRDADNIDDAQDNCPEVANPGQEDRDGDGQGDACVLFCDLDSTGMTSWWPAEGNADDVSGPDDGTLKNGATFGSGQVGQAFELDGVDDYVELTTLPELQGATALTVSVWIHKDPDDVSYSTAGFVGLWNTSPKVDNTFLLYNGESGTVDRGRFVIQKADNTYLSVAGLTAIPKGRWVHVAATWRASDGRLAIYKDGVLENSALGAPGGTLNWDGAFPGAIGEWGIIRTSQYKFHGGIDEAMLFTRALSDAEMLELYEAQRDGDNVGASCDNCPAAANADQADADQDGLGDVCDACPNDPQNDADGDGICGDVDACPNDPANDADADGVCGDVDNCPTVANPGQGDVDGDGIGDACDTPSTKDECKNDGWKRFTSMDFPNQGQCIQFVNTGK